LCWTTDLFELAETLWVTEQVVRDRLVTRFEGAI
jgi:hypothetical protein